MYSHIKLPLFTHLTSCLLQWPRQRLQPQQFRPLLLSLGQPLHKHLIFHLVKNSYCIRSNIQAQGNPWVISTSSKHVEKPDVFFQRLFDTNTLFFAVLRSRNYIFWLQLRLRRRFLGAGATNPNCGSDSSSGSGKFYKIP
jgi:hypothetical protein